MAEVVERHYHWSFLAFNEDDRFKDDPTKIRHAVEVTVIGYQDEAQALSAVMDLINREVYKLQRVWECDTCQFQKEMGRQISRLLTLPLKGHRHG